MRGQVDPQGQMFSYFSPESRVPPDHPLRSIKAHTDRVLKELSGELEALYAHSVQVTPPSAFTTVFSLNVVTARP